MLPVLFENEVTKLYKVAASNEIPTSSVVLSLGTDNPEVVDYIPVAESVFFYNNKGKTLADIYQILIVDNPNLTVNTIVNSYIGMTGVEDYGRLIPLIREVYSKFDQENIDIIKTINDVRVFHEQISEQEQRQAYIDYNRAVEITAIQTVISRVNALPKMFMKTATVVNRATFAISATIDNREINIHDGYDIFNQSVISKYIPYIQYNDSKGKRFYKVYRGKSLDDEPNYTNTVISANNTSKPDTIYLTLWLGDLDGTHNDSIKTSSKDTFQEVVFNLGDNRMTFDVPFTIRGSKTSNETTSVQRIAQGLPLIVLGQHKEIKVKAELKMVPFYNGMRSGNLSPPTDGVVQFEIYDHIMLHMILNDKVLSSHIYTEESMKPYPMKQRLDLHYRPLYSDVDEFTTPIAETYISNSSSVSFMANVKKTTSEETLMVLSPQGLEEKVVLGKGYNYLNISIKRAESREAIKEFVDIIELLMVYYFWGIEPTPHQEISRLNDIYERILPGSMNAFLLKKHELELKREVDDIKKNSRSGERISELSKNHGDVFGGCYSRKCQSNRQPKAVDTLEEAMAWREKTYVKDGVVKKRDFLPFPAGTDTPDFYIVCPDDKSPHPGVILNTTGHNQDKYPYVPCCFSSSQIKSEGNNYSRYYLGGPADDQDRSDMVIKKTKTSLEPGRVGYLPLDISGILNQEEIKRDIIRYGVIRSKSSLLHAVMLATGHPDYINSRDKEAVVVNMRRYMADNLRPELLKQEMYDISNEEILERLADPEIFLDPSIYYRAIEVIFKINIYVFSVDDIKENTCGKMEIPRYVDFHTRPLRENLPTVIIYKHIGSESDSFDYPQCELILNAKDNTNLTLKVFGKDMTRSCHFIMENTMGTITWTPPKIKDGTMTMDAYKNVYNVTDFDKSIGGAVSQYIDSSGKTRALTFYHNNVLLTMVTLPMQPINVPHSDEIIPTTVDVAMELFDQPSSVVISDGKIKGIWFSILDMKNSIYFRLSDHKKLLDTLPSGPPDPITTGNDDTLKRINSLKRVLSIYMQLLKWCFTIFRNLHSDLEDKPNVFFEKYTVYDTPAPNLDSLEYYNLSQVPYHIPQVESVEEAIAHIKANTTGMVYQYENSDKLVLYSKEFYETLLGEITTYDINNYGKEIVPAIRLEDYYTEHKDFIQQSGVEVFVGERDLVNWIDYRKNKNNPLDIKTSIKLTSAANISPTIYRHTDGSVFMIQNPSDGTINSAAYIAVRWNTNKVNVGPDASSIENEQLPSRIVYAISPNGDLVAIEDSTGGNPYFIHIIYYGTQADIDNGVTSRYGAMLPIL